MVLDIVTMVIVAAVLVLLVKNPSGSASLISSSGSFIQGETKILTGAGYS